MYLESLDFQDVAFVTLTYDELNVPLDYSLKPAHLTNWLKRFRKSLSYKIRYFACGEYGDKFGRPHYHAIIYGLKPADYVKVDSTWRLGNVVVGKALDSSFRYVAGYVVKKVGFTSQQRQPPFIRCSKGLGRTILDKIPDVDRFQSLLVGGEFFWIGRYLKDKYNDSKNIKEIVSKESLELISREFDELCIRYKLKGKALKTLREAYEFFYKPRVELVEARYKLYNERRKNDD